MYVLYFQTELERAQSECAAAELKASRLEKEKTALTHQLEENQSALENENKAKQAVQAKLRSAEIDLHNLQHDLDILEEKNLAAEKDKNHIRQQVHTDRCTL